MTNPSNSSPPPPSIERSADRSLTPSTTSHGRSLSHGAATISSQEASLSSDGDDISMSSQGIKKRDKILNFFRSIKLEEKAKTQAAIPETKIRHTRTAGTEARNDIDFAGFNIKVSSSETRTQFTNEMTSTHAPVFFKNVSIPATKVTAPKLDARFDSTSQLALCVSLLPRYQSPSKQRDGFEEASDHTKEASQNMSTDSAQRAWVEAIEQNPVKQGRINWLVSRIVEEFIKDAVKGPDVVSEVILLGASLDRVHYRKLLACFIIEFEKPILLDVDLLQGLVHLVQCALPTYLVADDLVKILSILRRRLEDTHQQSFEHQYHLTLAVSRILGVMAEPEHKVQDLPRVEEREPLASVLSVLQTSSDPYLMYQALYAFQALQYVPDEESPVQAVLRHSLGAAESLIKVSGVIQLNFDELLEGLKQMQKTVEETYGVAKSSCEGVRSLIDSGRGLFDSLRNGLLSGYKHPWYPAILSATAFCRRGQLEDLSKLIQEAPCRRDSRFQWGISQLLGEIAIDPIWEPSTRQQAVNFLGDLFVNDADWGQDDSVNSWMLTILSKVSDTPDRTVKDMTCTLLQVLKKRGTTIVAHTYPLRSHLPIPESSLLLALVQEIPYVEDDLDNLRLQRLEEYKQLVYIPPLAKLKLESVDDVTLLEAVKDPSLEAVSKATLLALPLMEQVKEFLASDRQVFLVLGDSGAGKSTFNRHLEHKLWKEYKQDSPIPLFINLAAIEHPNEDLISKHLMRYDFDASQIKELKQHRQLIIICDGYDESQLGINLHSTNSFNRPGHWSVKMIISCRSTFLSLDYRNRFQPQPLDLYSPATPHLFQEAVIVPFSKDQIKDYVGQFVLDTEVHRLFTTRPVWSAEEYMDKLCNIPTLVSVVTNPFLLNLSLRALPSIVDGVRNSDLKELKVTRDRLYEIFVDQWLEVNKQRLRSSRQDKQTVATLEDLIEGGFAKIAIKFLKELAAAIYQEQDGNPVVRYVHRDDKLTWKAKFFSPDTEAKILRDASPLTKADVFHRFIHRSLLEYFYSFDEQELHQFKNRRIHSFFDGDINISLFAKAGPQVSDEESFPLMEKVKEFLASDRQVFLVLGDSGAGKSTFNRHLEHKLWKEYKQGSPIPLLINLAAIDRPHQDLIAKHLLRQDFTSLQIQELKQHRQFIIICDGYDESQLGINLHSTNSFNRPGQWNVTKMIIGCRSTFIKQNYRDLFRPQQTDQCTDTDNSLYMEAVIVSFSREQIEDYINQYVATQLPLWRSKEYIEALTSVPNLIHMAKNPLLLTLALEVLPRFVAVKRIQQIQESSMADITCVLLYDQFVEKWLERSEKRAATKESSQQDKAAFESLVDEGFSQNGINFLKRLAASIYKEQGGHPVVEYLRFRDERTWKGTFFKRTDKTRILLDACPLLRSGNQYRFIHQSFLEYCFALAVFDPHEGKELRLIPPKTPDRRLSMDSISSSEDQQVFDKSLTGSEQNDIREHPLSWINLACEPYILQFLAERARQEPMFKDKLLAMLDLSKNDPRAHRVAANAIAILVRAHHQFDGADLRHVKIREADLSEGQFDSALLQGADLSALMRDAKFGES